MGDYSGNTTNVLSGLQWKAANSNLNQFSTIDRDNDKSPNQNCASQSGGGWWHDDCSHSRLNGKFDGAGWTGIAWSTRWHMKFVEMKIKKN